MRNLPTLRSYLSYVREKGSEDCSDDEFCRCQDHARICLMHGGAYSADDLSWLFEVSDYLPCGCRIDETV